MIIASLLLAAIFCIAGGLCLVAAAMNLGWFFASPSSLFRPLPRTIARIVAALLGCAILAMAITIAKDALSIS